MSPDHDIDTSGEYEYPPRKWQPEWVRPEQHAMRQATADAALIDRLHTAEARVAVLECERRADYQDMKLILARNAATDGGGTYNDLLHWVESHNPEVTE